MGEAHELDSSLYRWYNKLEPVIMFRKAGHFFALSGTERRFFFLAIYYSGIARMLILFVPFRKYSFWLGKYGTETSENEMADELYIKLVAIAVRRAQKVTPWRNKCLEQAMTAKKLLDKRKIKTTIYFGINKKDGKMNAHAWLRCGTRYVTGGGNRNDFTKVAWFS